MSNEITITQRYSKLIFSNSIDELIKKVCVEYKLRKSDCLILNGKLFNRSNLIGDIAITVNDYLPDHHTNLYTVEFKFTHIC